MVSAERASAAALPAAASAGGAAFEGTVAGTDAIGRPRCASAALSAAAAASAVDRKSTRLNSSHANISYAVFCLKKKKQYQTSTSYTNHIDATPTDQRLTL